MAVMVATTPREEERAAKRKRRDLANLQRAAEAKRRREARTRRAQVIREELAKPRARNCRCGISSRTTMDELMASGCTSGRWVCPVLDAIRRRLGR